MIFYPESYDVKVDIDYIIDSYAFTINSFKNEKYLIYKEDKYMINEDFFKKFIEHLTKEDEIIRKNFY